MKTHEKRVCMRVPMLAGYFLFPPLQPWGDLQAGCRRLALRIARRVRMNNGGQRLCQRVREQQVRKKAGLSEEHTQCRLRFGTRGQMHTKSELPAPRPAEARCPIPADPLQECELQTATQECQ